MDEKSITQDLIRALMFFGIINGWDPARLNQEFLQLGISPDLVNETLNQGIE